MSDRLSHVRPGVVHELEAPGICDCGKTLHYGELAPDGECWNPWCPSAVNYEPDSPYTERNQE